MDREYFFYLDNFKKKKRKEEWITVDRQKKHEIHGKTKKSFTWQKKIKKKERKGR